MLAAMQNTDAPSLMYLIIHNLPVIFAYTPNIPAVSNMPLSRDIYLPRRLQL
jgi:hypothetical protein